MNATASEFRWWLAQMENMRAIPPMVRLYRIGIVLMSAAIVLAIVGAPASLASASILTGASACAGSVAWEFYLWTEVQSKALWFKVLFSVCTVMSGAIATGAAMTYVAAGTGQEASTFQLAVALLAPLAFVPILCFAIGIVGICALPVVMALTLGQDLNRPADAKEFGARMAGRMIGVIALAVFALHVPTHASGVEDGLGEIGAKGAYFLDMQRNSRCASGTDRVARVNDDLVIVGHSTDAGIEFKLIACPLQAADRRLASTPSISR